MTVALSCPHREFKHYRTTGEPAGIVGRDDLSAMLRQLAGSSLSEGELSDVVDGAMAQAGEAGRAPPILFSHETCICVWMWSWHSIHGGKADQSAVSMKHGLIWQLHTLPPHKYWHLTLWLTAICF